MSAPGSIDDYLAELQDALKVTLARQTRILAEVGSHLREAAASEERRGANREQAEQCAVAAFGSPEELADSFGTPRSGTLGRFAVPVADVCYLVWRAPQRRWLFAKSMGWGLGAAVLIGIVGLGKQGLGTAVRDGLLSGAVLALFWIAFEAWPLRALPRPGYGRRWLKLTPAARVRVAGAVRRGDTLPSSTEAEFARELRARKRRSTSALWPRALAFGLTALMWGHEFLQGPTFTSGLFALLFVGMLVSNVRRRPRNATYLALAELAGLEILAEVASDVLDRGQARLLEAPHRKVLTYPDALYFTLAPSSAGGNAVQLGAWKSEIYVWAHGTRHQFDHSEEGLRELREHLGSVVHGVAGCLG